MRAIIDADLAPLERWAAMRDAETAVVFDAALGGHPVTLIGIKPEGKAQVGPLVDYLDSYNQLKESGESAAA